MTITERITALTNAIGAKIKDLYTKMGVLTSLNTTNKTTLVAAINEVKASAILINDAAASTTSTYSSTKIQSVADAAALATKNALLNGASSAYDTLQEIEVQLGSNGTAASNLTTAVANRVRFDAAQTLTTVQITQACNNIGIGEPDTDFSATFTTALS